MIIKPKRDLLGLKNLSAEEIREILHSAETMKYVLSQPVKKAPHLLGKSIVELFFSESIRTKLSFELAAKYMSGTISTVTVPTQSMRERIVDIAAAIDCMGTDVIIVRANRSGVADLIARHVKANVINGGDGANEQPMQALVDLFTIYQKCGKISGLKVAIVGDVRHSGVARSNIWGLKLLGAEVCVGGPATLIPPGLDELGVSVFNTPQEAMLDADVVMSVSLGKEYAGIMYPDSREYARFFAIDERRMQYAKPDAIVMHALPVRRGVELMSRVMSLKNSVLDEQVTNGVAVKMAVLYLYGRKKGLQGNEIKDISDNEKGGILK